jgi:hypothetical protein
MVMVLTVSTVRLIVRCLVAYAGGLDVSSFGFIVVRCSVLPVMFLCAFDDLRFNYYGFTLVAWVCYCYVSFQ